MNTKLPVWTDETLQALAYWIGYRQQLYNHYPIREGEIVGEILSLLSSKLNKSFRIDAEIMYKNLCNEWNQNSKKRADIIISKKGDKKYKKNKGEKFNYKKNVQFVIEVKRSKASKKEIDKDFERLSQLKEIFSKEKKDIRCFLLLISPSKKPKRYVTKKARGSKKIKINNTKLIAQTRLVKKSLHKFYEYKKNNSKKIYSEPFEKANYVCLIEIGKK